MVNSSEASFELAGVSTLPRWEVGTRIKPLVRNNSEASERSHCLMRVPVQRERSGVCWLPYEVSRLNVGRCGWRVRNCTTPPRALLPYRLEAPPRKTSTLEIASRGTRSQ